MSLYGQHWQHFTLWHPTTLLDAWYLSLTDTLLLFWHSAADHLIVPPKCQRFYTSQILPFSLTYTDEDQPNVGQSSRDSGFYICRIQLSVLFTWTADQHSKITCLRKRLLYEKVQTTPFHIVQDKFFFLLDFRACNEYHKFQKKHQSTCIYQVK